MGTSGLVGAGEESLHFVTVTVKIKVTLSFDFKYSKFLPWSR
jgi:hypothetical protein